jgi:hypothetical protein
MRAHLVRRQQPLPSVRSGPITQAAQSQLTTSGGQPYTFVQGQVAAHMTGVTLALSNGANVQATVADGSFVAVAAHESDTVSKGWCYAPGAAPPPTCSRGQRGHSPPEPETRAGLAAFTVASSTRPYAG